MKALTGSIVVLAAGFFVAGLMVPMAQAGDFEYVGAKNCKKCHLKQYKSWETTNMAMAYEILKPDMRAEEKTAAGLDPATDYTADEKCIACHVTGYGEPGGFVDFETTPTLAGVGCEVCHGPGGTYLEDEYMSNKNKEYKKADIVAVGMVENVGEAQCTNCHNEDSPFFPGEFDFDTMKDEGTHDHHDLKYEH